MISAFIFVKICLLSLVCVVSYNYKKCKGEGTDVV